MQRAVLTCHEHFCNNEKKNGALNETAKALKLCKRSVERIIGIGKVRASNRGKHERKPKIGKVDDFSRNLIRETIYSFYRKNPSQLLMLFMKI